MIIKRRHKICQMKNDFHFCESDLAQATRALFKLAVALFNKFPPPSIPTKG